MVLEKIRLCSFQPREVYDEILKKDIYRLSTKDFLAYTNIENSYKHFHEHEKYKLLMKRSGLEFKPDTMPIWGWYKDEFPGGFKEVSAHLYKDVLQRDKEKNSGEYKEMVGLILEIPKNEVYLTHFHYWDSYLFSERHDEGIEEFDNWTQEEQGWYLAEIAEAEYYLSKIDDIQGDVKVQGIFTEIRKDMITEVLF